MRFDSEFETLIGWIEGHMTLFWRILENKTSRTMTNHDETMTVKHHESWWTMTKPWQRNITNHDVNHDEPWRTMTNHDEPWRNHDSKTSRTITNHDETMTEKHHEPSREPWRTMMNHDEPWQNITKHHEPWRTITSVVTETSGRQHLF